MSRKRRAPCSPFSPRSSADERHGRGDRRESREAPVAARPRRNAFRPDLAAESLYGKVSAPNYAQGHPAQVVRASVPLRSRPSPTFGFETEALFGETVTVYDEREGWAWVQLDRDRYVGYVPSEALSPDIDEATHRVRALGTFVYPVPDIKSPPLMHLSMNAELSIANGDERFMMLNGGGFVVTRHVAERSRRRAPTSSRSPSASSARRTCGAAARASASTAPVSCS